MPYRRNIRSQMRITHQYWLLIRRVPTWYHKSITCLLIPSQTNSFYWLLLFYIFILTTLLLFSCFSLLFLLFFLLLFLLFSYILLFLTTTYCPILLLLIVQFKSSWKILFTFIIIKLLMCLKSYQIHLSFINQIPINQWNFRI